MATIEVEVCDAHCVPVRDADGGSRACSTWLRLGSWATRASARRPAASATSRGRQRDRRAAAPAQPGNQAADPELGCASSAPTGVERGRHGGPRIRAGAGRRTRCARWPGRRICWPGSTSSATRASRNVRVRPRRGRPHRFGPVAGGDARALCPRRSPARCRAAARRCGACAPCRHRAIAPRAERPAPSRRHRRRPPSPLHRVQPPRPAPQPSPGMGCADHA